MLSARSISGMKKMKLGLPSRRRAETGGARNSDPFEGALLVGPDIAHNQDRQEDHHFRHAEPSQRLVPYGPREQKYGFHIEDDKQDGDDVEAYGIPSARIRGGLDAA